MLLKVIDPIRQRQVATVTARRQLTVPEIERIVDRGAGALNAALVSQPWKAELRTLHTGTAVDGACRIRKPARSESWATRDIHAPTNVPARLHCP